MTETALRNAGSSKDATIGARFESEVTEKKSSTNKSALLPIERNDFKESVPSKTGQKTSKKELEERNVSNISTTREIGPDSLPESSTSGNEYRALRRKYLLLEEESFAMGKEIKEVEDEVKALEDEKLALLDQLVVLEGLIDPSEMQSQGV